MARGFYQLSLMTHSRVRVLEVSSSCPRLLTMWSKVPRCRPAVLDDPGLGQTSRDVEQLSQMFRHRVQGPACLIRCPGDSCLCPIAHGVDQQSRENWACAGGHMVSTRCPG